MHNRGCLGRGNGLRLGLFGRVDRSYRNGLDRRSSVGRSHGLRHSDRCERVGRVGRLSSGRGGLGGDRAGRGGVFALGFAGARCGSLVASASRRRCCGSLVTAACSG